jgi:hypothetical protein|tara:strand:- start:398 stop:916 length:519 start_codon:yes stop_codon:yes gene_type:complete
MNDIYIMNTQPKNGRVDIMGPNTAAVFSLSDRIPVNQMSSYREAMTGNWNNTPLSNAFFSRANIQAIQNGIRIGVYNRSNQQYLIGNQNGDELKIIMRSIFLQNAQNNPDNIPLQIDTLNNLVLEYAVHQVYGEAEGYMKYKRDASTLVMPMEPPVMTTCNDKQLLYKKQLF